MPAECLMLQTCQSLHYPLQLLRKRAETLRKTGEKLDAQPLAGEHMPVVCCCWYVRRLSWTKSWQLLISSYVDAPNTTSVSLIQSYILCLCRSPRMPLLALTAAGLPALLAGLDAVAARLDLLRALREAHTAAGLVELATAHRVSGRGIEVRGPGSGGQGRSRTA